MYILRRRPLCTAIIPLALIVLVSGAHLGCQSCPEIGESQAEKENSNEDAPSDLDGYEETEVVVVDEPAQPPPSQERESTDGPQPTPEQPPMNEPRPTQKESSPSYEASSSTQALACAEAVNSMGFELWRHLGSETSNQALGPASIAIAMSMVLTGAKEETADQLSTALRVAADETTDECWAEVLSRWQELDALEELELAAANRIFPRPDLRLATTYRERLENYYGTDLHVLNYAEDPEAARKMINAWVEESTRGHIVDLIPRSGIDQRTQMVLVNAMYMLGSWKEAFNADRTEESDFRLVDGTTSRVQMMNNTSKFGYSATADYQLLEMPYEGDELSMVVLLPRSHDGLPALESQLTGEHFADMLAANSRTEVEVYLPRFRISGGSISLVEAFESMGVQDLFHPDLADLSAISVDPHERTGTAEDRELYVSDIFHQAFVEVDEEGTEAAAASAIVMGPAGSAPSTQQMPPVFRADRPFLFAVRDLDSGAILFMGRVGDP